MKLRQRLVKGLIALGALALIAWGGVKASRWRDVQRRDLLASLLLSHQATPDQIREYLALIGTGESAENEEEEKERGSGPAGPGRGLPDDPLLRLAANRLKYGDPTAEQRAEFTRIAYGESQKWAALMPRPPATLEEALVPRKEDLVVGDTALSWANIGPADSESGSYGGNGVVDSGRPVDVRQDSTTPTTVYLATAGGGVWKTLNFGTSPTWFPVTDTIGDLALGAMDMDPEATQTLYIGTGDPFGDSGGQIFKTVNGGTNWSAGVTLSGTYTTGYYWTPSNTPGAIWSIRVDPTNSNIVLAATSTALFRSTNGGTSFSLITLPQPGTQVVDIAYSLVYTGAVSGVSRWALSGVYYNISTGAEDADIWTSTDAGATWSSDAVAGTLPATLANTRITLSAGTPSTASPPLTTIYAELGVTTKPYFWRSIDSGKTWTDATGTIGGGSQNCSTDVVAGQSWYNQAVGVDPANNDNVIVGGQLCSLMSLNGTSATPTWQNSSFWDIQSSFYVHADWHTINITRSASGYTVFAGTDGGLYYSTNVFTAASNTAIAWTPVNRGLITDLAYHVASGDPVTGNPITAFLGLQDNGVDIRDSEAHSTAFDEGGPGGDGIAAAIARGGTPPTTMYWATYPGGAGTPTQWYCNPATDSLTCHDYWPSKVPTLTCSGDAFPFLDQLIAAPANTTAPTVLAASNDQVFRMSGDPAAGAAWSAISPCLSGVGDIYASSVVDGLYAVSSGATFYVTTNCSGTTTSCTWTATTAVGGAGSCTPSSLSFPAQTPGGTTAGQVFVASCGSSIYSTANQGSTWTSIQGTGAGALPAVNIDVIRYDTSDTTNNTIYVGTDLGIYVTQNGGTTWVRFGAGMPLVKVTDLFIGKAGNLLRAATYGRGIWEFYPKDIANTTAGNGDIDVNGRIDAADLLGLAARLGSTPSTSLLPYYDYTSDLDSSGTIDETDLAALLAKFGSGP